RAAHHLPHGIAQLTVALRIDLDAGLTLLAELAELLADGVELGHALLGGRAGPGADFGQPLLHVRHLLLAEAVGLGKILQVAIHHLLVEPFPLFGRGVPRSAAETAAPPPAEA